MNIYSTPEQLETLVGLLRKYSRLPFSQDTIPGAVMESALAYVQQAEVLNTYDFVDVIKPEEQIGWQVKSTKAATPVTWKRAKIPDRDRLIRESEESEEGLKALGNAIIRFCNEHAHESLERYNLKEIGYSRLIIRPGQEVVYFEKLLCSTENPDVFAPDAFSWRWSVEKKTKGKEQLSALHGIHVPTQKKWFAWHGKGENQLHFSGENVWWPRAGEPNRIEFTMPSEDEKLGLADFLSLLDRI